MHNPIFLYAVVLVQPELLIEFPACISRRENFNDPIGGAETAFVVQFLAVADDTDVRLYNRQYFAIGLLGFFPVGKPYVKRSCLHLTGFFFEVIKQMVRKDKRNPLMPPTWCRRHLEKLPIDEFYSFLELPGEIIGVGVSLTKIQLVDIRDHLETFVQKYNLLPIRVPSAISRYISRGMPSFKSVITIPYEAYHSPVKPPALG